MDFIPVVAAVIRANGQVLLARRAKHKHQGGLWEFPGGKIEANETPEQALKRELREELAIEVINARPLFKTSHRYPEYGVHLDIWEVTEFTGEAKGAEGQEVIWVSPNSLLQYEFPEANKAIVTAARLPDRYLITPENLSPKELIQGIQKAVAAGIKLVCLSAPSSFNADFRDMAVDAIGVCAGKAQLMLKGAFEWLGDFPIVGWHVSAEQLRQLADKGRPLAANKLLAASCHNREELQLAKQFAVDFVTLSAVQPITNQPAITPLGWQRTAQLIAEFDRPIYVRGGLDGAAILQARTIGAQGVAATRGFWPFEL